MDESNLLAYFSISFKEITFPISDAISRSACKRMGAVSDENNENSRIRAYLIGQLGKNKAIEHNPLNLSLILDYIYGLISEARQLVGGRAVILECSTDEKLVTLYESAGFKPIIMEPNHNGDITMYTIVKD